MSEFETANTPEEWLKLALRHEKVALMTSQHIDTAAEALQQVGLATECALKAYIMHKERFNSWPSREAAPSLYTHDIRTLRKIANITLNTNDNTASSWHILQDWSINQRYDPNPTPRKVAKEYYEAAFGKDGVVTWLRTILK